MVSRDVRQVQIGEGDAVLQGSGMEEGEIHTGQNMLQGAATGDLGFRTMTMPVLQSDSGSTASRFPARG
jgi:hypothetical protein